MPRLEVNPCLHCDAPVYQSMANLGLCVRHYAMISAGYTVIDYLAAESRLAEIEQAHATTYSVRARTTPMLSYPLPERPKPPQVINRYQWQFYAHDRYGGVLASLITDADEVGLREAMALKTDKPVYEWRRNLMKQTYTRSGEKIHPEGSYYAPLKDGVLASTFNDGMPIPRFIRKIMARAVEEGLLSAPVKKIARKRKVAAKASNARARRA